MASLKNLSIPYFFKKGLIFKILFSGYDPSLEQYFLLEASDDEEEEKDNKASIKKRNKRTSKSSNKKSKPIIKTSYPSSNDDEEQSDINDGEETEESVNGSAGFRYLLLTKK